MEFKGHFINFLGSVILMAAVLFFSQIPSHPTALLIILLSISAIIFSSVFGFFETEILKISLLNCLMQASYFLLDYGTAVYAYKSVMYSALHLINFIIAGLLFAFIFFKFHKKTRKHWITSFNGLYAKNQVFGIGLIIACLSLGGLPAFNIFVGEYLIYSLLFSFNPMLALATIFGSLLAFLFYFRVVYIIFAGKPKKEVKVSVFSKGFVALLSIIVVVLGLLPWILFEFLGMIA